MTEQTPPGSQSRGGLWAIAIVVLTATVGFCAVSNPDGSVEQIFTDIEGDIGGSSRLTVELQIQGCGSLTYNNAGGNTEQVEERCSRAGGFSTVESFTASPGDFLYISIQNSQESGGVACRIRINGDIVESASSEGAYVIASCSGSA